MSLRSFLRLLAPRAAAVVVVLAGAGVASAADVPPRFAAPAPVAVAPPGAPCETCQGGAPAGCATCGKSILGHLGHHCGLGHKPCVPYTPHLCPGACFGYFQTQWHRWEDVCALPYQGTGMTDAPRPPTAPVTPVIPPINGKGKGTELPAPRPGGSDTPLKDKDGTTPKKPGSDSPLPPVPVPPGTLPLTSR